MAALHRHKAAGRRQSESRVRENRTHGLTRGCWGDHFKPVAYSTTGCLAERGGAFKTPQHSSNRKGNTTMTKRSSLSTLKYMII